MSFYDSSDLAASSNLARISFPSEVTSPAPMVMIKSFGLAPAIANSIAATIDGSKSTLVPISRICLAITELLAPGIDYSPAPYISSKITWSAVERDSANPSAKARVREYLCG